MSHDVLVLPMKPSGVHGELSSDLGLLVAGVHKVDFRYLDITEAN